MSPRIAQFLAQPVNMRKQGKRNTLARTLYVRAREREPLPTSRRTSSYGGPLVNVLAEISRLESQGYELHETSLMPEKSWACQWCHGTGEPQLSVHALEVGP